MRSRRKHSPKLKTPNRIIRRSKKTNHGNNPKQKSLIKEKHPTPQQL
jgi:hypothetical protein